MRRNKVVLSRVRGDINPADVLTKPKSLEDMKQLLNFSCIDLCEGESASSSYSSNCEVVNSVGRYNFVHNPTVRRRGGSGSQQFVWGPSTKAHIVVGSVT